MHAKVEEKKRRKDVKDDLSNQLRALHCELEVRDILIFVRWRFTNLHGAQQYKTQLTAEKEKCRLEALAKEESLQVELLLISVSS